MIAIITMKTNLKEIQLIFDSILCLCIEGPEVCTKADLIEAIVKETEKGYALCGINNWEETDEEKTLRTATERSMEKKFKPNRLMSKNSQINKTIQEIERLASWHYDEVANEDNLSPDDMGAHINGLIVQKCRFLLKLLK